MEKIVLKSKKLFVIMSLVIAIPSIWYLLNVKTIYRFSEVGENTFFLTGTHTIFEAVCFLTSVGFSIFLYYIIIKNRNKLFKDIKDIFKYILIIAIIYVFVLPFLSSDIFYYLGIGRLNSKYMQNPYYVTIAEYVKQNSEVLETNDTALNNGYTNCWADTTVVYGPIWTIVCAIIGKMSFGSVDLGVLLFKLFNVCIHILNCYFLYKISKKKIFVLLYGLNPYVLFEGIANVHNDMVLLLFMLIALYFLIKQKKLFTSLVFLSLATNIKFITVLFLPFFVIYHFRNAELKTRFIKCIKYGVIFGVLYIIPYIIYARDFSIFLCMIVQRDRICNGAYMYLALIFSVDIVNILKDILLAVFFLLYWKKCIDLLTNKNISWKNEMRDMLFLLIFFMFGLLTNFQCWYFIWLFMIIIWQKADSIDFIINLQITMLMAYSTYILERSEMLFAFILFGIALIIIKQNFNNKLERK